MNVKQSQSIIKIGNANGKMPGSVFSITAHACITGSKLVKVKGSTCSGCYALRIEKFRTNVHKAWSDNLDKWNEAMRQNPGALIESLVFQINRYSKGYHRWFDSGDLQSVDMLRVIVQTCIETPTVLHWLPTREASIVKAWEAVNPQGFPSNLVVRVSSPMIDGLPIKGYKYTSTVHTSGKEYSGVECKAYTRNNTCGQCRACWDKTVSNVSYRKH